MELARCNVVWYPLYVENPMVKPAKETWASGKAYEQYVGRWSRKVAREFLAWLEVSSAQTWADVGCGSCALVDLILAAYDPNAVMAIDRSAGFIAEARRRICD